MKKILFGVCIVMMCFECMAQSAGQALTEKNPIYAWKPGEKGCTYRNSLITDDDYGGNRFERSSVKGVRVGYNSITQKYCIIFPDEENILRRVEVAYTESQANDVLEVLYIYKGGYVDEYGNFTGEDVAVITARKLSEYAKGEWPPYVVIEGCAITIGNFKQNPVGMMAYHITTYRN